VAAFVTTQNEGEKIGAKTIKTEKEHMPSISKH